MSISVDHAQYYQPAYFNRAQAVSEAPPALPGADDQSAPPSGETLPPVQSGLSSQRLSGEDMRLLVLRDVGEDGIAAYEGILDQFFSDPANHDDPVAFLQNLSADGIDLLRQAQSLPAGANIDVNGLNREEALNFILPYSAQVDINNDGLIANANGGKGFRFPPPNASQEVKDAWNEATAGLSEKDKMLLSGKMFVQYLVANLHVDESGKVTQIEPGDPGYRNIFAEDGFSYRQMIEDLKQANEFSRYENSAEIYERTKELLARLGDAFDRHGVA